MPVLAPPHDTLEPTDDWPSDSQRRDSSRFEYDVFVSYSHRDTEWVTGQLVPRLKAAGLRVFIDYEELLPGQHLTSILVRSIKQSRHVAVVLSQSWCKSAWCNRELLVELFSDSRLLRQRLVPLMIEDCAGKVPLELQSIIHCDLIGDAPPESSWQSLLLALSGGLVDLVQIDDAVKTALFTCHDAVAQASNAIRKLNEFKKSHESVHRTDEAINLIAQFWRATNRPDGGGRANRATNQEELVWGALDGMCGSSLASALQIVVKRGTDAVHDGTASVWRDQLSVVVGDVIRAVRSRSPGALNAGLSVAQTVLAKTLAGLNQMIVGAAEQLPLDNLIARLTETAESLRQPKLGYSLSLRLLEREIEHVSELRERLARLVLGHRILQDQCDLMSNVTPMSWRSGHDYQIHSRLAQLAWRIFAKQKYSEDDWARQIVLAGQGFTQENLPNGVNEIEIVLNARERFRQYQSTLQFQFLIVDDLLLSFCDSELAPFGRQLLAISDRLRETHALHMGVPQ